MECTKCGNKMIEGYICPSAGIRWIPKYSRDKTIFRGPKKEGFYLKKQSIITWENPVAWYCEQCDLILIDCNCR